MLWNKDRYLVLYGGAGSGKSVFAAQKIMHRLLTETPHRWLLVRKVSKTIRNSQFKLFKDMCYQYRGLGEHFDFKDGDLRIELKNGNEVISAGMDDPEKIKSIQGITGIWIEEATELNSEDFNQLDLRLRGRLKNYKQIVLSFNPISNRHWLIGRFVNKLPSHSTVLKTTYRDNRFIDPEYKAILKELKNQDPNLYRIYNLGDPGILSNLIYSPYTITDQYPENFDEIIYGLDFGYNNPSALIEIGLKDQEAWLTERIYETKLTNNDLIERLKQEIPEKARQSRPIYADTAEPDRIQEIAYAGFLVYPSIKSVNDGIDHVKSLKIYSHPGNTSLHEEQAVYKWREDKDGNVLDEPVKFMDHLMDAKRYALYTHYKENHVIDSVEAY
jgi:phage terminase large subunit